MTIEEELFQKTQLNHHHLLNYGFKFIENTYLYQTTLLDTFKVEITIKQGKVYGHLFDLSTNEEYTLFRFHHEKAYASKIYQSYLYLLEDIKKHCFKQMFFKTNQANRITHLIKELYQDIPDFPWHDDNGVFRNPNNRKWYDLIMLIDYQKINQDKTGEVEVINVKLDPVLIQQLILQDGFYPAYHMNKKYWLTISLDDTLSDEVIIEYIKQSHQYTQKK